MKPFETVTGPAAPLLENDVNTDEIAPGMGGPPQLHSNYAGELFRNRRLGADVAENLDFVLNRPPFRGAAILVAGRNFGCGSSRETAVWALRDFGIGCVVARSFAESFRENCLRNGMLPVTLGDETAAAFEACVLAAEGAPFRADLVTQTLTGPAGETFAFDFPAAEREILLEGLDDIGMSERFGADIDAWEARMRGAQPWLQELRWEDAR